MSTEFERNLNLVKTSSPETVAKLITELQKDVSDKRFSIDKLRDEIVRCNVSTHFLRDLLEAMAYKSS